MANIDHQTTVDTLEFRRTMGLFATGITVMAVESEDGGVVGMTANAITSVSLEPPLILVCVTKGSNMAEALFDAPSFTFSFLSETQEPLSHYFAGLWNAEIPQPAFEFIDWEGGPRLAGSLGAIACRRYEVYEGGDHWIVLGEVTHLFRADEDGEPLIFFRGGYRRLADED